MEKLRITKRMHPIDNTGQHRSFCSDLCTKFQVYLSLISLEGSIEIIILCSLEMCCEPKVKNLAIEVVTKDNSSPSNLCD